MLDMFDMYSIPNMHDMYVPKIIITKEIDYEIFLICTKYIHQPKKKRITFNILRPHFARKKLKTKRLNKEINVCNFFPCTLKLKLCKFQFYLYIHTYNLYLYNQMQRISPLQNLYQNAQYKLKFQQLIYQIINQFWYKQYNKKIYKIYIYQLWYNKFINNQLGYTTQHWKKFQLIDINQYNQQLKIQLKLFYIFNVNKFIFLLILSMYSNQLHNQQYNK
eukprot:TRINITY_DN10553_c0_g1_i2.p3 TRINITY_DN10553_c0_g1~~TRINITY_DN10553_c0_g1_i2.p3  ORF type:complete len:219 (-),score=-10.23 TRINITY_DN10553_c0_g1_i2:165-821(-)